MYRDQVRRLKVAFTEGMGYGPEALDEQGLTIATGPGLSAERAIALSVGFGMGVGLTVEERYLEWARVNVPARSYDALSFDFLAQLAAEASRCGDLPEGGVGVVGFALSEVRLAPVTRGYRLVVIEPGALEPLWAGGNFHNALGRPERPQKLARILWGIGAMGGDGAVAALAATWQEAPGVIEIGVDVDRGHRGRGLAPAVVTPAVRRILELDEAPFYSCGASNIRSQRTALASGFLPACSFSVVRRVAPRAANPT